MPHGGRSFIHSAMIEELGPDIFLQKHPLTVMGSQLGRNVTIVRLASGKLVIHSTAPFSDDDVEEIEALGEPAWLVEATNYHDTFAREGRAAFPNLAYLVPPSFPGFAQLDAQSLATPPAAWDGELEVLMLQGAPALNETVFFHRPSKTLIVADLVFNLPNTVNLWTRKVFRLLSGIKKSPGVSRLLGHFIKDQQGFSASLEVLLQWDFERVIVAHGEPITEDAKGKLVALFHTKGLLK